MSIVGPRPLLVRYLDRYNEEQHHRHDVRPGLTGYRYGFKYDLYAIIAGIPCNNVLYSIQESELVSIQSVVIQVVNIVGILILRATTKEKRKKEKNEQFIFIIFIPSIQRLLGRLSKNN